MKIVIISAPIGSGHVKAGQAVGAALQSIDPDSEIIFANVFDFFPAIIGKTVLRLYLKVLSIFPKAYAMAYNWGDTSSSALLGRELISRLLAGRMLAFFDTIQPDAVVATHATPAGLVAVLLRQGKLRIPGIAVVTDFVVHRLWIYPELTHYCLANEKLRHALAAAGIPLDRSSASGIPVDSSFAAENSHQTIQAKLGLNPLLPTIMLMGGGEGLLPATEISAALDSIEAEFQILAVCGNNQNLHRSLLRRASTMRHRLILRGFVNNIAELMAISDLLITKPGGLTSAEAMCCGLPLVLYRPIPGQEEANARHLIDQGCAIRADSVNILIGIVKSLITDKEKRRQMSRAAIAAAKPDASTTAARIIQELVIK